MDTLEFMKLVLPNTGFPVLGLATKSPNGHIWYKFKKYNSIEEAAASAVRFDANGETVYFAVNTFNDWYFDEAKQKNRLRTQTNVHACRSLIEDFDVDPDKAGAFDTREEALAGIKTLAQAVKLKPTIVSSGGGYHLYFHMKEDVTADQWNHLSALKRDITSYLGVKVDAAVSTDVSRILRPVGTHNRKTDPPRPVELVMEGKVYAYASIERALERFISDNNVPISSGVSGSLGGAALPNAFAAALETNYPPASAIRVAGFCNAIHEFNISEGNIPEPHWHRAIGVLKHCTDGEEHIQDWSKGHPNYSWDATARKIQEWTAGPTLCVEMDRHIGCMANCKFAGKIKTPIQLGYDDEAPSVAEAPAAKDADEDDDEDDDEDVMAQPFVPVRAAIMVAGQNIPYWPSKGFRWTGEAMEKSHTDADGVKDWRPFSRTFVYPLNRIRNSEGTWEIHWRALEQNGAPREFFMPMHELAVMDQMAKTFASYEVFLSPNRTARQDMADFTAGIIQKLQEWRVETNTYNQFGWNEDRSGFVIGTKMITGTGEETVLCDPGMPADMQIDFGTGGTLDEWVSNIDHLYNRPGAEPFQFALCHSMGSALVELVGSSNWHGLPMALTGYGGTGKSTGAKIACGFYGRPIHMERQTGEQGSTLNAAIKRIALMGGVPVLLDEFSGRSPDELTRTGYALANGRDKERLGPNGKFTTTGGEWFKNSLITSNDSIVETISKLPAGFRVEATQLRFFEVPLPADIRQKVFPDVSQIWVEHHMDNIYGTACRPFLRFIINNQDFVRRQLVRARGMLNPKSSEDNKERFYRDCIVTAMVAGKIAEKIGLVRFDMKALKAWALGAVVNLRDSRRDANTDISEHVASFISTLPGRLIVTKRMGDGRKKGTIKEVNLEQNRQPVVGRVAIEDKVVLVTIKSMADWCKEREIQPSALRRELDRQGILLPNSPKTISPINIGAGSTTISAPARCYELDYDKLFSEALEIETVDDGTVTINTKPIGE